jgi:uncharacterized protein (DUF1501 family)
MTRPHNTRRDLLRLAALGFSSTSLSGWLPALASQAAGDARQHRRCILLWMTGGPSQIDTFDLKPQHANGGPFRPIDTSVPGIQIGEHLPKLAKWMDHTAIIRSMSTKEGDHSRAMYVQRTGHAQQGAIYYPTLGSLLSHRLGKQDSDLPNFISVAPFRPLSPGAFSPGFLGPKHAPLIVGGSGAGAQAAGRNGMGDDLTVRNIQRSVGITDSEAEARQNLLGSLDENFAQRHSSTVVDSHRAAYGAALRMIRSPSIAAFDLDEEPAGVRDRYGRNQFGQGCLLARRLVERGVPFVEVSLNGAAGNNAFAWDTHRQNFPNVQRLCETLDPAWSSLLEDLQARGLLETTLVVWMGEFGRTPRINAQTGRDHFPAAWSVALCGGGIRGGQVVGKTSDDGMRVIDRPVTTIDLLATICRSLNIDPAVTNMTNVGRPISLVDPAATPIEEILRKSA